MAVLTMDSLIDTDAPASAPKRDWIAVAARAHAILTQSLPDEVLDEISAGPVVNRTPFRLPAVLVG